jgi:hypothetical protein
MPEFAALAGGAALVMEPVDNWQLATDNWFPPLETPDPAGEAVRLPTVISARGKFVVSESARPQALPVSCRSTEVVLLNCARRVSASLAQRTRQITPTNKFQCWAIGRCRSAGLVAKPAISYLDGLSCGGCFLGIIALLATITRARIRDHHQTELSRRVRFQAHSLHGRSETRSIGWSRGNYHIISR